MFLLTIVHRETLSFSDEGARMERVAPGNFCRWWLRLEFTVTGRHFSHFRLCFTRDCGEESPKFEWFGSYDERVLVVE